MLLQSFSPVLGGAERQVEQLGPLLEARGVEVSVVTRRPTGTVPAERRPGLRVRRVRARGRGPRASAAYTSLGAAAAVSSRPQVLHAHDLLSPSLVAVAAGAAARVPVVVKVLSSGPHGDLARLRSKPLGAARLRALIARVAAFVCVSAEIERELAAAGAPPERLRRVPNGVDASRFRPSDGMAERARDRARLGLPPDAVLAVFCGRLTATKRLDLVVAALREAPVDLVLAGEGDAREGLLRAAREAGVAERLHVLDTLHEPAPVYRACDVFVTASDQDGLSNAVLEAMASGLPVITTAAGGMKDALGDRSGTFVEPDPRAFAAELSLLAGDPELRLRRGAAGRQRACARFSLEATADRLVALYEEVSRP